jgi:putative SOS response-associated peptidase YedK
MINARSGTAGQKPSFRTALKHRRCIVPANGFYEWQAVDGKKHPFYIKLKDTWNVMVKILVSFKSCVGFLLTREGDWRASRIVVCRTYKDRIGRLYDGK